MSANKRAKIDDHPPEAEGVKIDIHQLLESDPHQIAALGRHDDAMLSKLAAFTTELGTAVGKVKRVRKKEIAVARKARMQQEKASSIGCLECKRKVDNLKFCAELSDRHCGKGSVLCEKCFKQKKEELKFCYKCNSLLCDRCRGLSESCGSNGGGCGKFICRLCYLEEHAKGPLERASHFCDCGSWYCPSCAGESKTTRICASPWPDCNRVDTTCIVCDEQEYCSDCARL